MPILSLLFFDAMPVLSAVVDLEPLTAAMVNSEALATSMLKALAMVMMDLDASDQWLCRFGQ